MFASAGPRATPETGPINGARAATRDGASQSANPVFMCIRSHVHQLCFWPNVHFRGAGAGLLRKGTKPDSLS